MDDSAVADPLKEIIKTAVAELLGLDGQEKPDFFRVVVEFQQCKQELQQTREDLSRALQNWEVWHALAMAREEQVANLMAKVEQLTDEVHRLRNSMNDG